MRKLSVTGWLAFLGAGIVLLLLLAAVLGWNFLLSLLLAVVGAYGLSAYLLNLTPGATHGH